MKRTRICIDARFYHTGTGVARYIKNLLKELKSLDTDTHYTIIVRPPSVDELNHDKPSNWTVVGLDIVHYSFGEQTTFLFWLNKQKFDLVYFTMFNHPILYRGKSIVMIHDLIMHMYPPRPWWHPRTLVYKYVMWHAAHKATAIINNSETTKHDVVKFLHVPAAKCHAILLAVEDSFRPVTDKKTLDDVKAKFGITKPFLFFLNAWRPHKGLPELVQAFAEIKKEHDVELVLGGKPDKKFPGVIAAVEAVKKTTDGIITPGFIADDEIKALMSSTALYINPSHYEGFGFGLLEAMSCGAPVLAADNPCLKEVGADASAYFKTKSADDLATQMSDLLDNPARRAELIKLGHHRVKDFSFTTMTKQTVEVFKKVLTS